MSSSRLTKSESILIGYSSILLTAIQYLSSAEFLTDQSRPAPQRNDDAKLYTDLAIE